MTAVHSIVRLSCVNHREAIEAICRASEDAVTARNPGGRDPSEIIWPWANVAPDFDFSGGERKQVREGRRRDRSAPLIAESMGGPGGPGLAFLGSWVASRDRVPSEVTSRGPRLPAAACPAVIRSASGQAPCARQARQAAIGRPLSCVIHSALSHSRTALHIQQRPAQLCMVATADCPHAHPPTQRVRNLPPPTTAATA